MSECMRTKSFSEILSKLTKLWMEHMIDFAIDQLQHNPVTKDIISELTRTHEAHKKAEQYWKIAHSKTAEEDPITQGKSSKKPKMLQFF